MFTKRGQRSRYGLFQFNSEAGLSEFPAGTVPVSVSGYLERGDMKGAPLPAPNTIIPEKHHQPRVMSSAAECVGSKGFCCEGVMRRRRMTNELFLICLK